jgi:hypothetical protein
MWNLKLCIDLLIKHDFYFFESIRPFQRRKTANLNKSILIIKSSKPVVLNLIVMCSVFTFSKKKLGPAWQRSGLIFKYMFNKVGSIIYFINFLVPLKVYLVPNSSSIVELASLFIFHLRALGLNLGIWIQICMVVNLKHYLLIYMYKTNNVGSHSTCCQKPLTTIWMRRGII